MMKCIECDCIGSEFNLELAGIDKGTFLYIARCPRCGSHKIRHLPGCYEGELAIVTEKTNLRILSKLLATTLHGPAST